MPLKPEQHQLIVDVLRGRSALKPCEACGKSKFTLLEDTAQVPISPSPGTYTSLAVPSAVVVCDHCGHIRFHALGLLGLGELGDRDE